MKLLLLFLLLTFSTTSFSQVWIDQNAKWHYDYWNTASVGFFEMDYVQDTLVGDNYANKL